MSITHYICTKMLCDSVYTLCIMYLPPATTFHALFTKFSRI
nr:MAG TPA: hypothetical protein [Bacteriophage sp.]